MVAAQEHATQPVKLKATWYPPRKIVKDVKNPLAVLLASPKFPVTNNDYWVQALWRLNFCTLVLQSETPDWSNVRVDHAMKEIVRCPQRVNIDPKRVLLVADKTTGGLAIRWMDGYPGLAGVVLISTPPVERTAHGLTLWTPRKETWGVPIWTVVGTNPTGAAGVLGMWRKLAGKAPANASLTIDTRLGRGGGFLLPDEAIENWLETIAADKRPASGPDRQAEEQKKQYISIAEALRKQMVDSAAAAAPSSEQATKKDGPFTITVSIPDGWRRIEKRERAYNPDSRQTDSLGKPIKTGQNPFAEIYLSPQLKRPFFVRVCAAKWDQNAAKLLNRYDRGLLRIGCLSVPLVQWRQDKWAYRVSSILMSVGGKWHRWLTLSAARDGTKNDPVAPLILMMDASDKPDLPAMATAMKRLCKSVKVRIKDKR
jgi:hypothetical protein